jgi:hypothetical protein
VDANFSYLFVCYDYLINTDLPTLPAKTDDNDGDDGRHTLNLFYYRKPQGIAPLPTKFLSWFGM